MSNVLLSSGGLDSAVIAAMRLAPCIHLTVDYGQRHRVEIEYAAKVAEFYGAEHIVLSCPIASFGGSVLSGEEGELVGSPTVVPNRNAVLIALAVSLSESRGGGTVFIGCNADDYADYPDCRPEFIAAANALADASTGGRVIVKAPFLDLGKKGIGELARELSVPTMLTWSCYAGGTEACWKCGACEQRAVALWGT